MYIPNNFLPYQDTESLFAAISDTATEGYQQGLEGLARNQAKPKTKAERSAEGAKQLATALTAPFGSKALPPEQLPTYMLNLQQKAQQGVQQDQKRNQSATEGIRSLADLLAKSDMTQVNAMADMANLNKEVHERYLPTLNAQMMALKAQALEANTLRHQGVREYGNSPGIKYSDEALAAKGLGIAQDYRKQFGSNEDMYRLLREQYGSQQRGYAKQSQAEAEKNKAQIDLWKAQAQSALQGAENKAPDPKAMQMRAMWDMYEKNYKDMDAPTRSFYEQQLGLRIPTQQPVTEGERLTNFWKGLTGGGQPQSAPQQAQPQQPAPPQQQVVNKPVAIKEPKGGWTKAGIDGIKDPAQRKALLLEIQAGKIKLKNESQPATAQSHPKQAAKGRTAPNVFSQEVKRTKASLNPIEAYWLALAKEMA